MDSMTPDERLDAVMHCHPTARVPTAPKIEEYAGKIAGITNAEFIWDSEKGLSALDTCHDVLGGWDFYRAVYIKIFGPLQKAIGITRSKLPGLELAPDMPYQALEEEVMRPEDYDLLIGEGLVAYNAEFWRRAHGVDDSRITTALAEQAELERHCNERARSKVMVPLYGGFVPFALDFLWLARSLREFSKDLFRRPDQVEKALTVATEGSIQLALKAVAESGVPRVFMGFTRGSATFMSPKMFRRFCMPFLKRMVDALSPHGIMLFLHADGDWTMHMEAFRELPRHSVVLELDGTSDIFGAKRILGDHLCLLGDVNATLLTLGTPERVQAYCRRLIDEVGTGGGFILGSGCTVPLTAKRENVEAMLRSVHSR